MNLKQAHYIQTIAREGGITAAAKKLHISQPSLSQMLKQVEGELGVARRVALGTGSCMLCSNIFTDGLAHSLGGFYPLRDYENHRHFYACCRKQEHLPKYVTGFIQIVFQVLSQPVLSPGSGG